MSVDGSRRLGGGVFRTVGDVATTYCECSASYSTKREVHVVVVDNPDCPIHHPK